MERLRRLMQKRPDASLDELRKWLRVKISHLKSDHRMGGCFLARRCGGAIAAGTSFTFGLDSPQASHGVSWSAEDVPQTFGTTESFGSPSGDGVGLVHGPIGSGIPTVSEWGIIVMVLLALTAGTVVFARWLRAAAA